MKLLVSFSHLSIVQIIARAMTIKAMLTNHPDLPLPWPAVVPTPDQLGACIARLETAREDAKYRDTQKVAIMQKVKRELKELLEKIAKYVEIVAGGDERILQSVGFQVSQPRVRVKSAQPDSLAALIVKLKRGTDSGTLVVSAGKVDGAANYEVELCEGNGSSEEAWRHYGFFSGVARIIIGNLTPGVYYSVRIRAIGNNIKGPWSLPVTLMVV